MSKHTVGPWKIDDSDELPLGVIADNEEGTGVCEIQAQGYQKGEASPEQWANAHLIAAAPELLDEIEKDLNYLRDLQEKHLSHCAAVVRALVQKRIEATERIIRKARGGDAC